MNSFACCISFFIVFMRPAKLKLRRGKGCFTLRCRKCSMLQGSCPCTRAWQIDQAPIYPLEVMMLSAEQLSSRSGIQSPSSRALPHAGRKEGPQVDLAADQRLVQTPASRIHPLQACRWQEQCSMGGNKQKGGPAFICQKFPAQCNAPFHRLSILVSTCNFDEHHESHRAWQRVIMHHHVSQRHSP